MTDDSLFDIEITPENQLQAPLAVRRTQRCRASPIPLTCADAAAPANALTCDYPVQLMARIVHDDD